MTVSTVVAGLLPIMWSNRVGADVMKPLATPVLGGMVSSLIYVLSSRRSSSTGFSERRLGLAAADEPAGRVLDYPAPRRQWATGVMIVILVVASLGLVGAWRIRQRAAVVRDSRDPPARCCKRVIAAISRSRSRTRAARCGTGDNDFRIEFRSARTNAPIDVGDVRLNAAMTMPGMAMTGTTSD